MRATSRASTVAATSSAAANPPPPASASSADGAAPPKRRAAKRAHIRMEVEGEMGKGEGVEDDTVAVESVKGKVLLQS